MLVKDSRSLAVPYLPSPPDKKTGAYESNTSNTNALMTDMWQRQTHRCSLTLMERFACGHEHRVGGETDPPASCFNLGMKSNVRQD